MQQALINGKAEGENIQIDDSSGIGQIEIKGNYKQELDNN